MSIITLFRRKDFPDLANLVDFFLYFTRCVLETGEWCTCLFWFNAQNSQWTIQAVSWSKIALGKPLFADINLRLTSLHTVQEQAFLSMAVPLTRNAFAEKTYRFICSLWQKSENVLFSFFLHKTSKRYSFRKIFAVLDIILRLQKKGTEFLGNDHYHHLMIIMSGSSRGRITIISTVFIIVTSTSSPLSLSSSS